MRFVKFIPLTRRRRRRRSKIKKIASQEIMVYKRDFVAHWWPIMQKELSQIQQEVLAAARKYPDVEDKIAACMLIAETAGLELDQYATTLFSGLLQGTQGVNRYFFSLTDIEPVTLGNAARETHLWDRFYFIHEALLTLVRLGSLKQHIMMRNFRKFSEDKEVFSKPTKLELGDFINPAEAEIFAKTKALWLGQTGIAEMTQEKVDAPEKPLNQYLLGTLLLSTVTVPGYQDLSETRRRMAVFRLASLPLHATQDRILPTNKKA